MWTTIEAAFHDKVYARAVAPSMRAQAALVRSLLDELRRRAGREDLLSLEEQLLDEFGRLARMIGAPELAFASARRK